MIKYLPALTLFLAACGGGNDVQTQSDSSESAPPVAETPAPSPAPTPAPEQPIDQPEQRQPVAPSEPAPPPSEEPPSAAPAPVAQGPQLKDGVTADLPCVRGNNGSRPTFRITYANSQTTNTNLERFGSSFTYQTAPSEAVVELHGTGATYSWKLNGPTVDQTWLTLDQFEQIIGWGSHGYEPSLFVACGIAANDIEGIRNR